MEMNLQQIKEAYLKRGLNNYRLSSLDDLVEIHGVDIEKIKGFNKFGENGKAFLKKFLVNFFNAQGIENRMNIEPTGFVHTAKINPQLKFKVIIYGKNEWYLVTGVNTWG